MLSQKVKEEILEAQSHLRAALSYAARNEKTYVSKALADILCSLETIEKAETIVDRLENRKPGDNGSFGAFFTDF
jgi:hypothetical protein